jgi:hypothetical protein
VPVAKTIEYGAGRLPRKPTFVRYGKQRVKECGAAVLKLGGLPLGRRCNLALLGTVGELEAWNFRNKGDSMTGLTEEEIRKRAYEIWKGAGEPSGKMDTFWYLAEKELLAERSEQGEVPPGMTDNLPV